MTVSVSIPPPREPRPAIGVGDAVFVALYCRRGAFRHAARARMAWATGVGLFAAGAIALWLERAVPALPTIGLMVLATQPKAREVPGTDRRATMLAAAMLISPVARAHAVRGAEA